MRFAIILVILLAVFSGTLSAGTASYDTLTIYDLQYVPDPATNDQSPYFGDTVVVKGMVMHYPRDLYVGARWATYIVDKDSFPNPWSGFFIIQHDTVTDAAINTLFSFVEPGMECYFTGVVDEYVGFSQIFLLTNPVIPIEIISTGNPIPDPVKLTTADLTDDANAEQWESMWVALDNVKIVSNAVSSNRASITDDSDGLTYLDDYFMWFRGRFDNNAYSWPGPGTLMNVKGFMRQTAANQHGINPRDDNDLEQLSSPPSISTVRRNPGVPNPRGTVKVSAVITDNIAVSEAILNYSVDWNDFIPLPMTISAGDTFTATIPNQSDGSFVRYFISAIDNDDDETTAPGDTANSMYYYVIRASGLTIKDVQYTWGYRDDASGFRGYEASVEGIVTANNAQFFNSYYLQQEEEEKWSGIWISDPYHTDFQIGDKVRVTGLVQETFGVTRIQVSDSANGAALISQGHTIDPIVVTTGEITTGGENAEAYESVLIRVENLTVTNPFPDSPGNFGEFTVSDGSGPLRVDDNNVNTRRDAFNGNYDSTFVQGDPIDAIVAIHYYSFGNYKILPRDNNDIIGHTDIGDEPLIPAAFTLRQNYPNPFNPQTSIEYSIQNSGEYTLTVYNVLGQQIARLAEGMHYPGSHRVLWSGLDQHGKPVSSGIYFYRLQGKDLQLSKKMILMR